jgi:excisionase family DNA binding protein
VSEPLHIPNLMTEREAAGALGVSLDTLRRLRRRNAISFTMIGGRVRYTEAQLLAYIERETRPCHESKAAVPARSATIGSRADPTLLSGAGRGSIPNVDRQSVHLLALKTFRRQS